MMFVNRREELEVLEAWWERPGPALGVVWGRRRVGKTWLLGEFAQGRRAVRHVARNRPMELELQALTDAAVPVVTPKRRDLTSRPFRDWDDAFDVLSEAAERKPLLLVLDEFPELLKVDPRLPSALRAIWERVETGGARLRLLLCGSAVRTMEALQEERAALFGRATLRLLVQPFRPHEAALMLRGLTPPERARAWGVCGGIPHYLALWDQGGSFADNLARLVCSESGVLLAEGDLVLRTEEAVGRAGANLPEQVLRTIAAGRTAFSQVRSATGQLPTRVLDDLVRMRLIQRVVPVTGPAKSRLTYYRIADNFLAFWLGVVERHRVEIEAGQGAAIVATMVAEFDDFMGPRYEEAFRDHLRRVSAAGELADDIVAVGEYWRARVGPGEDPCQLDAVALAGRARRVVVVGEAKWARRVHGDREAAVMARKVEEAGLETAGEPVLVVCARESVSVTAPVVAVTAEDLFP